MKAASSIAIALAVVACVVALALSVYPGVLSDVLFLAVLLSLVIVPVVGIVAVVALILLARKGKLKSMRPRWRLATLVVAIFFCTWLLLRFYVPRRIAFTASRASFAQLVPQAASSEYAGRALNRRLGAYRVDEYAADPRGGVYFRVHIGVSSIGPDRMSYGFAYRPNTMGTPFGAVRYRVFRLGNEWYWFRASDDWY